MILSTIADAAEYRGLSPRIATALTWLAEHYSDSFVKGSVDIGDGIIVKSEEPALMPREKASLETHSRFIDIHVPLKGTETIGWAPAAGLKHVKVPYNSETDIAFWGDAANSLLHVKVGQMAIFFPSDAHAPNIGLGNHRKLCIKIPV